MRDIKFRGKSIDSGEWFYGDLLKELNKLSTGIPVIVNHDSEYIMPRTEKVNINTVGQYTGSKDKNGVEIYEGDIFYIGDELIGIVEWEEENARFIMSVHDGSIDNHDKDSMYVEDLYIYPFEMMEIIGNIHEGVKDD